MKRKLLLLAALVVVSAFQSAPPAKAFITCGYGATCSNPYTECICPYSSPARGMLTACGSWRADCWYM